MRASKKSLQAGRKTIIIVIMLLLHLTSGVMAPKFLSGWSMARVSWKMQRITKTKQWEVFRQLMLLVILLIWFSMATSAMYHRLSDSGADLTDNSAPPGPIRLQTHRLLQSRKFSLDLTAIESAELAKAREVPTGRPPPPKSQGRRVPPPPPPPSEYNQADLPPPPPQ